jgi:hypothetical protein
MDFFTLGLLMLVIVLGVYGKMLWLAIVGGIILLAYAYGSAKSPQTQAVPTGGPKVRPIIVQRRYEGPESIYPPFMKIRVNPEWGGGKWWENAGMGIGKALMSFMLVFSMFKGKQ